MQCVKPRDHNKRHCEICGKPISGKVWSKRAPQNKVPRCIEHLQYPGHWSIEETVLLKQLYPTHTVTEIAKQIGRSKAAIQEKVHQLGIEKTRKYHMVFSCQICGKDMPSGKTLPSDFFVACEACVKKVRRPIPMEANYK
jgi:ribosomal protein L34E